MFTWIPAQPIRGEMFDGSSASVRATSANRLMTDDTNVRDVLAALAVELRHIRRHLEIINDEELQDEQPI